MKDHNPHDPVNMIGEAYELFVEKTMHDLHVTDGKESTTPVTSSRHSIKPKNAAAQPSLWIENKKFLLKNSALEYLNHAGDKTTVMLRRLNHISITPDKLDDNENTLLNKLHGHNVINPSLYSAKNNAHQYKKCNNKSFRRLQ